MNVVRNEHRYLLKGFLKNFATNEGIHNKNVNTQRKFFIGYRRVIGTHLNFLDNFFYYRKKHWSGEPTEPIVRYSVRIPLRIERLLFAPNLSNSE